jgi:hypothetical protein
MPVRLSIGDFAKMTYLSIKSLRRYHDIGLLVPAAIAAPRHAARFGSGTISTSCSA